MNNLKLLSAKTGLSINAVQFLKLHFVFLGYCLPLVRYKNYH